MYHNYQNVRKFRNAWIIGMSEATSFPVLFKKESLASL